MARAQAPVEGAIEAVDADKPPRRGWMRRHKIATGLLALLASLALLLAGLVLSMHDPTPPALDASRMRTAEERSWRESVDASSSATFYRFTYGTWAKEEGAGRLTLGVFYAGAAKVVVPVPPFVLEAFLAGYLQTRLAAEGVELTGGWESKRDGSTIYLEARGKRTEGGRLAADVGELGILAKVRGCGGFGEYVFSVGAAPVAYTRTSSGPVDVPAPLPIPVVPGGPTPPAAVDLYESDVVQLLTPALGCAG